MNTESFSPTEAISFGWKKFKENKKFWVIAAVLSFILGGNGNLNLGNSFGSDDESETTTTIEQNTQFDTTNEINIYNNAPSGQMQMEENSLPLVPKQVDEVLGISDQRDSGNMAIFFILFALVMILMIPFFILSALVGGGVQMGLLKFFLTAARGAEAKYETILSEINLGKSLRFLSVSFLYVSLVVVGLIFFIIPGIYFAVKYMFASWAVVDRDAKIGEAFSLSSKLTRGNKWNLIGLGILVMLVNLLGLLALFYGLLVSIPVTALASAYAYNKLSKSST